MDIRWSHHAAQRSIQRFGKKVQPPVAKIRDSAESKNTGHRFGVCHDGKRWLCVRTKTRDVVIVTVTRSQGRNRKRRGLEMDYAEMVELLEEQLDGDVFAEVMDAAEAAEDPEAYLRSEVVKRGLQPTTPAKPLDSGQFEVLTYSILTTERGKEVSRVAGYYLAMQHGGRRMFTGSTFQFVAKPEFVGGMFLTVDAATKAAETWLEVERINDEVMANRVPVSYLSAKVPVCSVPECQSAQIKRALTPQQTRLLKGIQEAFLQKNARMPSGEPVKSLADTLSLLLDTIAEGQSVI